MTILGAIIQPDLVLCWTDTENYAPDGTPAGRFNKLRVAACGPVIGFGGGWNDLLRYADTAVADSADVDEAAERVAAALRQHMVRSVTTNHAREPDDFGHQVYVVAGWSPSCGRMLGYRLAARALFAPVLVSRIASPECDGFAAFSPSNDDQVARFARQQIEQLRAYCPAATGGDLLIGTLSSAGTFIRAERDFAAPLERIPA